MLNKKLVSLVSSIYIEEIKRNIKKLGYDSFNIEPKVDGDKINIELPEKYKFIETGRASFSKKIPILALIKFLKKNGVKNNINDVAHRIQESIYKKGIKAKKDFISKLYGNSEDIAAEEIENFFNETIKNFFN